MSSLKIESTRERFPGKSDEQIAEAIARKEHYIAVLRYKHKGATNFTDFAVCHTENEISACFESPYCQEVQLLYDGRSKAHYCPRCGQRIHTGMITVWPGGEIPDNYRCAGCNCVIDDLVRTIVSESDEESLREMEERGKKEMNRLIARIHERYGELTD